MQHPQGTEKSNIQRDCERFGTRQRGWRAEINQLSPVRNDESAERGTPPVRKEGTDNSDGFGSGPISDRRIWSVEPKPVGMVEVACYCICASPKKGRTQAVHRWVSFHMSSFGFWSLTGLRTSRLLLQWWKLAKVQQQNGLQECWCELVSASATLTQLSTLVGRRRHCWQFSQAWAQLYRPPLCSSAPKLRQCDQQGRLQAGGGKPRFVLSAFFQSWSVYVQRGTLCWSLPWAAPTPTAWKLF